MYYNTGSFVAGLDMNELNVVMVYGIGALILVIIPVVVISGYELKQIKQSQSGGIDAIAGGVIKIFVYSLLFLFFVMLVFMALIGMSNSTINPAFGIDAFFRTDWLDASVPPAMDGGVIAGLGNPMKLESAKSMVAILTLARFIYILLLMTFFIIMYSIAVGVAVADHKKSNDTSVASLLMKMFLATVVSVAVFMSLLNLISAVLNAMLWFSDHIHATNLLSNGDLDIKKDLVYMFNAGLDHFVANI